MTNCLSCTNSDQDIESFEIQTLNHVSTRSDLDTRGMVKLATSERIHDQLLVLQCQEGDSKAFEDLVTRWQPRLWRYARQLTGDNDAASDVVQNAWMAIIRGIKKLDDQACFRQWAYSITSHKFADWRRHQKRQQNLLHKFAEQASQTRNQPNVQDVQDDSDLVHNALTKLPGHVRALLTLRYLEDFNIAEIAGILSIPEGTVKSRLYHARSQFTDTLKRQIT